VGKAKNFKILSFVTLFIFASLAGVFIPTVFKPSKVAAWSGNLPTCELPGNLRIRSFPGPVFMTFSEFLTNTDGARTLGTYGIDLNNYQHSYAVIQRQGAPSNQFTIFVENSTGTSETNSNIQYRTDEEGHFLRMPSANNSRETNIFYQEADDWYSSASAGTTTNRNGYEARNLSCISYIRNITPHESYTGIEYISPEFEELECDTLDLACQLQKLFNGVQNTFIAVAQAILEGIYNFFVPDLDVIVDLFNTVRVTFEEKLGFMAFPFTFIAGLFNTVKNSGNCEPNCTLNFGNFFGRSLNVDPLILKQELPTYYNTLVLFMRGSIIFAVVVSYYRKYLQIVRH